MIRGFRHLLATHHNLRAHFWQTLANNLQQGFGMVFGIILARLLSPSDFGHFAFATATIGLFLLPGGWSLAPQIVAEGGSGNSHQIVSDSIRAAYKITIFRVILLIVGSAWLFWQEGVLIAEIALFCGFPMAMAEFVAIQRASLEARGNFKPNVWDAVLTMIISMGISIPAALLGAGAWALALPALPLFFCQLLLFQKLSGIKLRPFSPPSGRSYFSSGLALWISFICEQVMGRADKFFLGKYCLPDVLGNYNRAYNYSPLSARIFNSLLANPTVTALARASHQKARMQLVLRSGVLLAIAGIVNFVLLWFFADPLVPFLFGPQWREAIPVFQAMAPLGLAISFSHLPITFLLAQRRYVTLAIARICVVSSFIIACILRMDHLNAVFMAWLVQIMLFIQGVILFALAFCHHHFHGEFSSENPHIPA